MTSSQQGELDSNNWSIEHKRALSLFANPDAYFHMKGRLRRQHLAVSMSKHVYLHN